MTATVCLLMEPPSEVRAGRAATRPPTAATYLSKTACTVGCAGRVAFVAGVERPALGVEAQGGSLTALPDLPQGHEALPTARYIEAVLAGEKPVPAPIATQVAALVSLARASG